MSELYALIDAEEASFGISLMCSLLGVSRSGYYEWKDRPASTSQRRRGRLGDLIVAIFDASGQTYGYRRVHAELARAGVAADDELVRRLMRSLGWSRSRSGGGVA